MNVFQTARGTGTMEPATLAEIYVLTAIKSKMRARSVRYSLGHLEKGWLN